MSDDGISIELQGDRALAIKLGNIREHISNKIIEEATAAGIEVFAEIARELAPVKTGKLASAIRTIKLPLQNGKGWRAWAYVGEDAPYALSIEFGAQPHAITPRNKKALAFGGKMYRGVKHPGITAHPFMRPAASSGAPKAFTAVQAKIATLIEADEALRQ